MFIRKAEVIRMRNQHVAWQQTEKELVRVAMQHNARNITLAKAVLDIIAKARTARYAAEASGE